MVGEYLREFGIEAEDGCDMAVMKGEGRNDVIFSNWSVPGRADQFNAWLTRADVDGRTGAIVIAHDLGGLTPWVKELARTLSRQGYACVVPDLYYRSGVEAGTDGIDPADIDAVFSDGRMLADLDDAAGFLASSEGVDPGRMGVVGIGTGGRLAMLLAARHPYRFRCLGAIDPLLGKAELPDGSVRTRVALEEAAGITCATQVIVTSRSENCDEEELERLATELGERGQVFTYGDAGPGLLDEDAPEFDPSLAADALGRILGFLDSTVGSHLS